MKTQPSVKRIATVKQLAQLYPAFPESSIRWLIFNEKQNNFKQCVTRIGRKIVIDLDEFENWIASQGSNNNEKN